MKQLELIDALLARAQRDPRGIVEVDASILTRIRTSLAPPDILALLDRPSWGRDPITEAGQRLAARARARHWDNHDGIRLADIPDIEDEMIRKLLDLS